MRENSTSSSQVEVDCLRQEVNTASERIHSLLLQSTRMMSIGAPLLVALLGFSWKTSFETVVVIIPILFFILFFFWLDLGCEMVSLGGYRRFLEERLNELAGKPVLLWESEIAADRHSGRVRIIIRITYAAVMALFIVASLLICWDHGWRHLFGALLVVYLLLTIAFVAGSREKTGLFLDTYKLTKLAYARSSQGISSESSMLEGGIGENEQRPDALDRMSDAGIALSALRIQWDDFFQTRRQTWNSLFVTILFVALALASDSMLEGSNLWSVALAVPVIAVIFSALKVALHHRKVQIDKFNRIGSLEIQLGLAKQQTVQAQLPTPIKIKTIFDPRSGSTPLFIIRAEVALLALVVIYSLARATGV